MDTRPPESSGRTPQGATRPNTAPARHTTAATGGPGHPGGPARKAYNQRTAFTCGGCDRTWTGNVMAHCSVCHETFGSVASFDRHRRKPADDAIRDGHPVRRTPAGCTFPPDLGLYRNPTRSCWSETYNGTAFEEALDQTMAGNEEALRRLGRT